MDMAVVVLNVEYQGSQHAGYHILLHDFPRR